MAIQAESKITYRELTNLALNKIMSICKNIDTFDDSVPPQLKYGYEYFIRKNKIDEYIRTAGLEGDTYFKWTLLDQNLDVVTSETVREQFSSFLEANNIDSKSDKLITSKGILHFFNCLYIFSSVKLAIVTSLINQDYIDEDLPPKPDESGSEDPDQRVIYYLQNMTPSVTTPFTDDFKVDGLTDENIRDSFTNLDATLNSITNVYTAKYTMTHK